MKRDEKLAKMFIDRFDRLEMKVDRVLEEKIPKIERDVAVVKTQAGIISTAITLIGGGLAVVFTWFKK